MGRANLGRGQLRTATIRLEAGRRWVPHEWPIVRNVRVDPDLQVWGAALFTVHGGVRSRESGGVVLVKFVGPWDGLQSTLENTLHENNV